MTTGAERMRRLRARRREGLKALTVECHPGAVGDWLAEKGFLELWDADDPAKVARALAEAVRAWSEA